MYVFGPGTGTCHGVSPMAETEPEPDRYHRCRTAARPVLAQVLYLFFFIFTLHPGQSMITIPLCTWISSLQSKYHV